jgi:hypothetical protein
MLEATHGERCLFTGTATSIKMHPRLVSTKKKAMGLKVSSRLLTRSLNKTNLPLSAKFSDITSIEQHLKEAYQNYYRVKGNQKELRNSHLENLAEALAEHGDTKKEKMLKILRERESQRCTARKIRFLRGKLRTGSTTVVTVFTQSGTPKDLTEKEDIEQAIIRNNQEKYQQSFPLPFLQPTLAAEFGFKGLSPAAQAVLLGMYLPPSKMEEHILDYLSELSIPEAVQQLGPQSFEIPTESYRSFWNKAKENISCYPDALSFSSMKAGSFSPLISEIECMLTSIPLQGGFAPDRWKRCIDVMILKRSGITVLSGLRTIVLFPADCNFAFKHVGRKMMQLAEKTKAIAPEQYGSRKGHKAIDLAVNKTLTNDILRQLKQPGAICSNDAKSCYDLIGHTQAALSMQRNGVPKSAIDCLFSTLQNAKHQVRTGYGDSTSFYGGSEWVIPMHGVGQGNGAGPAIWAVVSTPILNMIRKKGYGCTLFGPMSHRKIYFVGYTFVDDTDLIYSNATASNYKEVINGLQSSIKTWDNGLKATGGALVPEKTFWYLIDFQWSNGNWKYTPITDAPGSLYITDLHGNLKELRRCPVDHAETTLGVDLAPDGNTVQQEKKMYDAASQWADSLRTGKISKTEAWLALQSTIMKTLTYPLPALNLTQSQCDHIMQPILKYVLPAMGVCRNFPRTMVYAPKKYMGIGIRHPYTTQETARIMDIINHTFSNTTTGQLHRHSLELMFVEIGVSTNFHELPYNSLHILATDSLAKSTWKFLHDNDISLEHDIVWPAPRDGDISLMVSFLNGGCSKDQLIILNKCRLYLRAFYLSDIVNGNGSLIESDSWNGRICNIHRQQSWPNQGKPPPSAWELWRTYIRKCFLGRGLRLYHTLGTWRQQDSSWPWYYAPASNRLYNVTESTEYICTNARPVNPIFCHPTKYDILPDDLCRATIIVNGNKIMCTGFASIVVTTPPQRNSFQTLCQSAPAKERWLVEHFTCPPDTSVIAHSIRQYEAMAVSDGSFQDSFGTAAWVIETDSGDSRLTGKVITPGGEHDQDAYRSELSGIAATVYMVNKLCTFHGITGGGIEFACDGLSALNTAFSYVSVISTSKPSYDVLAYIQFLWKNSPVQWKIRHVSGHQDDRSNICDIDRWGQLNIEMDRQAKQHIAYARTKPRHFSLAMEPWSLWFDGNKIITDIENKIYERVHAPEAQAYWTKRKNLNEDAYSRIHWEAISSAMEKSKLHRRIFISKHVSGMCGVGKFMHRWRKRDTDTCPRCTEMEDAHHVYLCKGIGTQDAWNEALNQLSLWMDTAQTDPEIATTLIKHLHS